MFIKRKGLCGPAESRNRGLEIASGDYVVFLDDDDTLAPSYLETLYLECENNRRAVLYGNFQVIYENRDTFPAKLISEQSCSLSTIPFCDLYVKNFIPNNVLAYPRISLWKKRFDRHLSLNEIWNFLLNVAENAEFQYRDMCGARIHKDDPSKQSRRGAGQNGQLPFYRLYVYLSKMAGADGGNQTAKTANDERKRRAMASSMVLGLQRRNLCDHFSL